MNPFSPQYWQNQYKMEDVPREMGSNIPLIKKIIDPSGSVGLKVYLPQIDQTSISSPGYSYTNKNTIIAHWYSKPFEQKQPISFNLTVHQSQSQQLTACASEKESRPVSSLFYTFFPAFKMAIARKTAKLLQHIKRIDRLLLAWPTTSQRQSFGKKKEINRHFFPSYFQRNQFSYSLIYTPEKVKLFGTDN